MDNNQNNLNNKIKKKKWYQKKLYYPQNNPPFYQPQKPQQPQVQAQQQVGTPTALAPAPKEIKLNLSFKVPGKLPKAPHPMQMALFGLVALLIAGGTYLAVTRPWPQKGETKKAGQEEPVVFGDKSKDEIVEKAGKLFLLPEGEKPKIGTVQGVDKLKSDPFFKNAKDGDKVLVYENAKRAFIYRPSENKMIEVGGVGQSQDTTKQPAVAGAAASRSTAPKVLVNSEDEATVSASEPSPTPGN